MRLHAALSGLHSQTGDLARTAKEGIKDDEDTHGNRYIRAHRGRKRPLLGRPGGAFARQLQDRLGETASGNRPCARHREAGGGARQHCARWARSRAWRSNHQGGTGGDRWKARRAFSAGRLADRIRHSVQHERQRGDIQPRDRDAGRHDGLEDAGPPQRPCQHEPIVE